MIPILLLCLFILAILFGVTSISQSNATAKQAQASIETARVAEIASISNLVIILLLVLLVLAIIGFTLYFLLHIKTNSLHRSSQSTPSQVSNSGNANWDQLLTLLLVQFIQNQMEQNASQLNLPPTSVEAPMEDNDLWFLP